MEHRKDLQIEMQSEIFTSLSCEKTLALLKEHTAPQKKGSEKYAWKAPGNRRNREQAWLVGTWEEDTFNGKVYRFYDGETSGGMASPRVTLKAEPAGNLGKISYRSRYSIMFLLTTAVFVLAAVLLAAQIIVSFPNVTAVSIVGLVGWIALCALMYYMFTGQYQHECEAIELALKTMTKAFDK